MVGTHDAFLLGFYPPLVIAPALKSRFIDEAVAAAPGDPRLAKSAVFGRKAVETASGEAKTAANCSSSAPETAIGRRPFDCPVSRLEASGTARAVFGAGRRSSPAGAGCARRSRAVVLSGFAIMSSFVCRVLSS